MSAFFSELWISLADPPVISTVSFRKRASEAFQLLVLIAARKMKTSETLLAFRLKKTEAGSGLKGRV